jgi:hypothetical protein
MSKDDVRPHLSDKELSEQRREKYLADMDKSLRPEYVDYNWRKDVKKSG